MKKLTILMLLFLTLTTGIFSQNITNVTVAALKGPTGLAMVNLIEKSDQILDNFDVEYSVINTPTLAVSGLIKGEIDIAALPTNLAATIYNKKSDYVIGAITGDGTLYVVSSREDIKSWNDLKGKTVYNISRNATPGFLFNYLLEKNNISPETDVNVDYKYDNVQLAPLLIAGKVDTGILPEPLVTNVLLKNKSMKVVLDFQKEYQKINGGSGSYPLSCVVIKKDLVKNNPEFVKEFLSKLEESINFVKSNPTEAGNMGQKIGLGVSGPLIKQAIERINFGYKDISESRESLDSYYQILFNSDPKSVGGKMPDDGFYINIK